MDRVRVDSRMLAAIARGRGLVTAQQLARCGFDARLVRRWVKTGRLVTVRRGVHTTAELWDAWDLVRERPLAQVRAVELTLRVPHVHSHDSAALALSLPLIRPQEAGLHVTRRHLRASTTKAGVRHHRARYGDHRATTASGLTVLDIPRTVADLAREHGYRAGLVAADGAMQLGVSRSELAAAAQEMVGWPYSSVVDAVVADADPGAESVLESLSRELLAECGLGPAETQFPVRLPDGVAWVDMRVGRHLFEADGRIKFVPDSEGGYARTDPTTAAWDERRRQQQVCGDVFGMSRITWADLWGSARDRAKLRLVAEAASPSSGTAPSCPQTWRRSRPGCVGGATGRVGSAAYRVAHATSRTVPPRQNYPGASAPLR